MGYGHEALGRNDIEDRQNCLEIKTARIPVVAAGLETGLGNSGNRAYPTLGNSAQHVVYLGDRLSWRMCQGRSGPVVMAYLRVPRPKRRFTPSRAAMRVRCRWRSSGAKSSKDICLLVAGVSPNSMTPAFW